MDVRMDKVYVVVLSYQHFIIAGSNPSCENRQAFSSFDKAYEKVMQIADERRKWYEEHGEKYEETQLYADPNCQSYIGVGFLRHGKDKTCIYVEEVEFDDS